MYSPKTHDSFYMQFGFRHPDWKKEYSVKKKKKNVRRKSSSNLSKLNE